MIKRSKDGKLICYVYGCNHKGSSEPQFFMIRTNKVAI